MDVVPFILMVTLNWKMVRAAKKSNKTFRKIQNNALRSKRSQDINKMMGILIGNTLVFIVTMLPLGIYLAVVPNVRITINTNTTISALLTLTSFNYAVNFYMYILSGSVFRQELFGLSKERPILDHHPKAHIHEIRQISGEIQWISCEIHPQPYKIRCFNKNSSVWGGAWRGL